MIFGRYYEDANLQQALLFKIEEGEEGKQVKGTLTVYRSGKFQLDGKGFEDGGNVQRVLARVFPALCRYNKSTSGSGSGEGGGGQFWI